MSENMKNNVCGVCGNDNGRCGECGHSCGFRGGHIIRWVLGVLIIVWVFSIGMKFGEIKAYLQASGYGYHQYRTYPMPMMGAGYQGGDQVYFSESAPASVTVSSGTVKAVR